MIESANTAIVLNCTEGRTPAETIMRRKALFDGMLGLCKQAQACPSCACAAALYAAFRAAHVGLNMSLENFLEAAKEVYQDAMRQEQNKDKLVL